METQSPYILRVEDLTPIRFPELFEDGELVLVIDARRWKSPRLREARHALSNGALRYSLPRTIRSRSHPAMM